MNKTTAHDNAPRASAAPLFSVGVDLVLVRDVEDALRDFGPRYLRRVYTPGELAYCIGGAEAGRRLAARFAAKEAVIKVLRPTRPWLDWRDIEVLRAPAGWCELRLHGEAERLRRGAGITSLSVSLSHEGDYAIAAVSATREKNGKSGH